MNKTMASFQLGYIIKNSLPEQSLFKMILNSVNIYLKIFLKENSKTFLTYFVALVKKSVHLKLKRKLFKKHNFIILEIKKL